MSRIVQKHYFQETIKVFALILSCLFLLFVLIDYSSRAHSLGLSLHALSRYYGLLFISRLDVLAPFSLMLAGIRTLCQANIHLELVALRASGCSLSKGLRPFLWLGLAITCLLYANNEWVLPQALHVLHQVEDHSTSKKQGHTGRVHAINLPDGSRLLYGSFDPTTHSLIKCYWIRSFDDIWRIDHLKPWNHPPIGYEIEKLARDANGQLIPMSSVDEEELIALTLSPELLVDYTTLPMEQPLSQLWSKLPSTSVTSLSYEQVQVEASFWKKLTLPWLCLIALMGPAPFCVAYRRPLYVFFIFAGSLFGLFGLYVLLSAGYTLAQNQVLPAALALGLPTLAVTSISCRQFLKMR